MNLQGTFGESSNQTAFNLDDKQQGSYFIAVEHPLPLIPNAKISSTTLDTEGQTTLTSTFNFGGQSFAANAVTDTTIDLSYIDYTLYYELFDNDLLTFDFGITARDVDADIKVNTTVNNATVTGKNSASAYIPMLYTSAIVGLPFTGFNVFAEGNFLSFDDHTLYDYQAGISYELVDNIAIDANITFGYRALKLELEDLDDLYTNIDFKGVFVGAVLHF